MIELYRRESNNLNLVLKESKAVPVGKNFIFCKERFLFYKKNNKYFRLCNKDIFIREKRKLRFFKRKLDNCEIQRDYIHKQYKCVKNSLIHRANTKKSIIRLEKYYMLEVRC